jgi:hypothetical protein
MSLLRASSAALKPLQAISGFQHTHDLSHGVLRKAVVDACKPSKLREDRYRR